MGPKSAPLARENPLLALRREPLHQGRPRRPFPLPSSERGSAIEAPIMVRPGNVAVSRGSSPGLDTRRGLTALLLLAALAPATAVAQRTPQPVFTELFAYDPAAPSQLLEKWLISSRLDSKLQRLRVGVVEDPSGKTVGRVTVQEGDGLDDVSGAVAAGQALCLRQRGLARGGAGGRAWRRRAQRAGGDSGKIRPRDRRRRAGEIRPARVVPLLLQDRRRLAAGHPGGGTPALPHRHPPDQAGFLQGREVVQRQPLLQDRGAAARRARALLRAGGRRRTLRPAADGVARAALPARPAAGELDHGAGAPQSHP
jgi:hypothetical protein